MRIDLHTHSVVSDGTDQPGELVAKAAAAGLDVVALTDHDTTDGWAEAGEAAERVGIRLVRGLEISTDDQGYGLHLLAYEPDPEHAGLRALCDGATRARRERVKRMVEVLQGLGYQITQADVDRQVGRSQASKQHVAGALVEAGSFADRAEVFPALLNRGRPADVPRAAKPSLVDAIALVLDAGGVPVLAHPWGRGSNVPEPRLAELTASGLVGIEVDHQDHAPPVRALLREIADRLGLLTTGSSDFHGANKENHELGSHTTSPEVLEALLARVSR